MSKTRSRRRKAKKPEEDSLLSSRPKTTCALSNEERQAVCEMYLNQHNKVEISAKFGVHKSTITRIVQRFIQTDSHELKKKGGRTSHKKLQDDQLELVKEFYQANQEAPTLQEVRNYCQMTFGVSLSLGTAFNVVKRVKTKIRDEEVPLEIIVEDDGLEDEVHQVHVE